MTYGHAERNLALLRQLETETRHLLEHLDQPGAGLMRTVARSRARGTTARSAEKDFLAERAVVHPAPKAAEPAAARIPTGHQHWPVSSDE
jgi:hypothetical protein